MLYRTVQCAMGVCTKTDRRQGKGSPSPPPSPPVEKALTRMTQNNDFAHPTRWVGVESRAEQGPLEPQRPHRLPDPSIPCWA